jgi:hypothetical protein
MLAGGPEKAGLARDTIFAALMIIVNGVVGISVLVGALAHGEQSFRIEGAGPALAALVTLATLSLVLPTLTTSSSGPTYSEAQLLFAAVVSFILWALYLFVQTARHRDYFLPTDDTAGDEAHAEAPSLQLTWASFGLLLVSLIGVVGLTKALSPSIEDALEVVQAPKAVIGILIALLVLLPESLAAVRHALANRLQISMNLALGSALGQHRADDPRGGAGCDLAGSAAGPWPGAEGHGPVGTELCGRDHHPEQRPHDPDAGRRAPGDLCGLRLPGIRALVSRTHRRPTPPAKGLLFRPRHLRRRWLGRHRCPLLGRGAGRSAR